MSKTTTLRAVAMTFAVCGCAGDQGNQGVEPGIDGAGSTVTEEQALRRSDLAFASLRDANGAIVGSVAFVGGRDATTVFVTARLPDLPELMDGIHGFHVHANDNPANGEGCIADPAQPANTWFVSADGHFNPGGGTHGSHAGDMPALFFTTAGKAAMTFITDRFAPADVKGRAVILHAGADNYGNVPIGTAPNQYTPNSADATTLTNNTGNAGNRIACGVIR